MSHLNPTAARFTLIALAYYLSGWVGLQLASYAGQVSLIWPPTGIALFALLVWGRSMGPAIWLGAFAVNLHLGDSAPAALVIAIGNTLGPLLAAIALERLGFRRDLGAARDAMLFVGIGAISGMAVTATIGTATLAATGAVAPTLLPEVWLTWWLGDALGALLIGPALLTLAQPVPTAAPSHMPRAEALLAWGGVIVIGLLSGTPLSPFAAGLPPMLPFPFLVWLALRQNLRHTAWAALLLATLAVWGALAHTGPFINPQGAVELPRLWTYLLILGVVGLLVTALRCESATALATAERNAARLREAEQIARLGHWELDLTTQRLTWSDEIFRLFELDPARFEASYEAFLAAIHPDDRERVNQAYQASVSSRSPYAITHRLRMPDGRVKHVHEVGRTDYRADGTPQRSIGTVQDVTAQEEARQSQLRDAAVWTEVMSQFDDCIYILDPQRHLVRANRAFYAMVGGAPEALMGRHIAEIIHPQGEAVACPVCRAQEERRDTLITLEADHPDNPSGRPVEIRIKVLRDPADGPAGLMVSMHDLSNARRMQAALAESESRFREIFDSVNDAIFLHDAETGRIVAVNRRMLEMYGLTQAEALASGPEEVSAGAPPHSAAEAARWLHRAVTEGPQTFDWLARARDGRLFWVEVSLRLARIGDRPQILAVVRDISERKAAEAELATHRHHLEELVAERTRELAAALDAAESASRAKSLFLANMSHELRTPLNAILGFAQLMERAPHMPEEERRNLATIARSGNHLLAIINDVLEISRIEAGRARIENAPFDLPATLVAVAESIRVRAEAKGLALRVERPSDLPSHCLGDAPHLRQVLLNLLGNAVKYTNRGEVRLGITPLADGLIRFEVGDTGPGIAPEDQARLFQPFYQTDVGIAKGEGTGLGLPISRQFIRLMGGELEVTSRPGEGSLFVFSLPLPPAAPPAEGARRVIGLAPGQPVPRILVAEDHPDNRRLIELLLRQVDLQVHTVADGRAALDALHTCHPHLILMDMRMPVMDGYEAARAIRSLPEGQALPIVALTASTFEEDRDQVLAAGCNDLLRKPIDEARLFEVIGRLLGLRFLYEEAAPREVQSAADLGALPAEVRAALIEAAESLDPEAVHAIAEGLRATHPAEAAAIAALSEEFHFDQLQALCGTK